ncbi:hypothetical protein [Flavihumibacter sp. CACIAM 22H1]|uniref:hypothetical protein n=1 Tax=Flavihumibacter sp. CACIAM 22H1 TaxID=1812911 RepID=UPI0007A92F7F|nr:hypothetical protein [Flavihumibacter sp. CACIAM 22H1]KYP16243.1 MAG: hypothetical protein A1D16_20060 [Flavihumibacter sp. CACIAM 22H1]
MAIKNLLDNENNFDGGKGASIFHAYENIVRRDDNTGYDKLLHFTFSATHGYTKGISIGKALGLSKELFMDEIASWFIDDIGWDKNDIKANETGLKFAEQWREYFRGKYGELKPQQNNAEQQ